MAVSVTALAGELTTKNNVKTFFIKVIDTKITIALSAGAPSTDVSFLRQALVANTNFSVTPFIQRQAGDFATNPLGSSDFTGADCIVLAGFPVANTREDVCTPLPTVYPGRIFPCCSCGMTTPIPANYASFNNFSRFHSVKRAPTHN